MALARCGRHALTYSLILLTAHSHSYFPPHFSSIIISHIVFVDQSSVHRRRHSHLASVVCWKRCGRFQPESQACFKNGGGFQNVASRPSTSELQIPRSCLRPIESEILVGGVAMIVIIPEVTENQNQETETGVRCWAENGR